MIAYIATPRRATRSALLSRLAALVTLIGATACGGSDDPTSPQTPTAAVRLTNGSSRTIAEVYVSPCTSDTWGSNRLSGTISPAGVRTFSLQSTGCHDVRVVATDGHAWRRDDVAVSGTVGVRVD